MLKEIEVKLLPTEKKAPEIGMIATTQEGKLQLVGKDLVDMFEFHKQFGDFAPVIPYQYLYFLSNDEIKEGDWFMEMNLDKTPTGEILQCTNPYINQGLDKKIIATTDESLVQLVSDPIIGKAPIKFPTCSEGFIQAYIESYNKGKVIEKVMVEYTDVDWIEVEAAISEDNHREADKLRTATPKLRGNEIIIQ